MSNKAITTNDLKAVLDVVLPPQPSEYRKLLWTNPSPTSTFSAQTVSLNLTDYDEVEIDAKNSTSNSDSVTQKFSISSGGGILTIIQLNDTWYMRQLTISNSGIAFASGRYCYMSNGGNGVLDAVCVPTKIYGIKYERVAPPQLDASDYVIEQDVKTASDGTVWNCRKWNSGVAECWCKVHHTITGWQSWYSWYYSRPDTTKFSFPTNFFIDVPIVEASRSSGIAGVLCEEGAPSATQTQQYYLIRPDSPSANGFNLDIHAIGKWK